MAVPEKHRGVCAWLLTPLSTLHHAIQATQLTPFTFSIRLLLPALYLQFKQLLKSGDGGQETHKSQLRIFLHSTFITSEDIRHRNKVVLIHLDVQATHPYKYFVQ